MRLHFQDRPWDLYVCVGYTLAMAAALLVLNVGNLLAILLVLFIPGYVLVAALFPGNKEIDWIERIALSVGLSIAVVPLLGLLLNFTPLGIRFGPIVGTITGFTLLIGLAAYWRRLRLPMADRLSATLVVAPPAWKEYAFVDKVLTIALGASIVIAGATLVYVLATPRPGETFTEFFILGPGGNASGYPTNLTVGEPGTVIVGLISHEARTINYAVQIDLVGVNITYNATCGCNQSVELNRTTLTWLNQSLEDSQNWTYRYTFSIGAIGTWKVDFFLHKDGVLSTEKLHLFVRVG